MAIKRKSAADSSNQGKAAAGSGWQPGATAPRDGTMILADVGFPWSVPAVFDPYDEQWIYATLQASPMENGVNNFWLETDTEKKDGVKRWMPMPAL